MTFASAYFEINARLAIEGREGTSQQHLQWMQGGGKRVKAFKYLLSAFGRSTTEVIVTQPDNGINDRNSGECGKEEAAILIKLRKNVFIVTIFGCENWTLTADLDETKAFETMIDDEDEKNTEPRPFVLSGA